MERSSRVLPLAVHGHSAHRLPAPASADRELLLGGADGAYLHFLMRDGGPLVLTNLPEALGMRGGTYTLSSAWCALLPTAAPRGA